MQTVTGMDLLDNITWHTLAGPHARFAVGNDTARRYARGFSPIVGFANPDSPDFAALAPHCERDEQVYIAAWAGLVPPGWQMHLDSTMVQMVYEAALPGPGDALDAVALQREHASQAVDLATLTRPGPFGLRTIELGEYFGCFESGRLVAMAGERMHAGTFREISGVAAHPEFQGRGLTRGLMLKLIRGQILRGETPFLHVMRDNSRARDIYKRIGFRDRSEVPIRVVSRL
jgi:ribosomal protein S18 acetylase RimI-like enzyme